MNSSRKFAIAVAAAFVVLQCMRPAIPSRPASAEIQVSPHIHQFWKGIVIATIPISGGLPGSMRFNRHIGSFEMTS